VEEGTIRIHLHRIYGKLGTNNRVALVTCAQDLGVI
jgi:DNA-binding CsgD family transcriptional regulator